MNANIILVVSNEALWPDPVDVLDRATRFLVHDAAEARVVPGGGAVGDGEVVTVVVAVHEHGDVEDLVGAASRHRLERQLAVGRHIEGDLEKVCAWVGTVSKSNFDCPAFAKPKKQSRKRNKKMNPTYRLPKASLAAERRQSQSLA